MRQTVTFELHPEFPQLDPKFPQALPSQERRETLGQPVPSRDRLRVRNPQPLTSHDTQDFRPEQETRGERTTSMGTVIRSTVEALEGNKVRILEYCRKPRHGGQFKRAKQEEGAVIPFEHLGLKGSFEDFFMVEAVA